MWVFLSVLAICLTFLAWKYIDEACSIDVWEVEKRVAEIERHIYKIVEMLKEGGKDD